MPDLAEKAGHAVGVMLVTVTLSLASSLVFSWCWNHSIAEAFSVPALSPRQSLCLLAVVWITGRFAFSVRRMTVEIEGVKTQEVTR